LRIGLKREKEQNTGENCMMSSCVFCTAPNINWVMKSTTIMYKSLIAHAGTKKLIQGVGRETPSHTNE
jgi:hypothetical protein